MQRDRSDASARLGRAILTGGNAVFVAMAIPVIARGGPLADDLNNCLAPQEMGLGGFLGASWERLGMIRLARFAEILLTTGVCRSLPFGVAIAVVVALAVGVGLLARGLLRDLDVPEPWPSVAATAWFLQPLGTEAGMWPAALHVPLGLCAVLVAARCHRRGRHAWAGVATVVGVLSVEQAILALPFIAWLVAPPAERRRAVVASSAVVGAVLVSFVLWPGSDPRLDAGPIERLTGVVDDPAFFVGFPAVGLGLHSIPLAALWALPWSVGVLAAGAALGLAIARRVQGPGEGRHGSLRREIGAFVLVLVLVNVPVILAEPRQGSPRIFTPTWLVLAIAVGWFGARASVRSRAAWTLAGIYAAGAVLSLALSVSVRLASADVVESAAGTIAARVPDGAQVAVCGVRRTVTSPAPRGAFAVHEFVYDWAAADAYAYHTGERAAFTLSGELWPTPCPRPGAVDAVFRFEDLVAEARP